MRTCQACAGDGWLWVVNFDDPDSNERDICPNCDGEGVTA